MANGIKDTDNGYAALAERVFGIRKPVLTVGVHAAEGALGDGQATVLDVGTWNEFGTRRIPPRSFIRAWYDAAEPKLRTQLATLMKGVIAGARTADQALEILGLKAVGEIQGRISAGIAPQNADSTVKQKGSSKPLIDTGTLRSSITHKVTG